MAFEPLDELLIDAIRDELELIFEYDPRVELLGLDVTPFEDENRVFINATLNYIEFDIVDDLNININTGSGL